MSFQEFDCFNIQMLNAFKYAFQFAHFLFMYLQLQVVIVKLFLISCAFQQAVYSANLGRDILQLTEKLTNGNAFEFLRNNAFSFIFINVFPACIDFLIPNLNDTIMYPG